MNRIFSKEGKQAKGFLDLAHCKLKYRTDFEPATAGCTVLIEDNVRQSGTVRKMITPLSSEIYVSWIYNGKDYYVIFIYQL